MLSVNHVLIQPKVNFGPTEVQNQIDRSLCETKIPEFQCKETLRINSYKQALWKSGKNPTEVKFGRTEDPGEFDRS